MANLHHPDLWDTHDTIDISCASNPKERKGRAFTLMDGSQEHDIMSCSFVGGTTADHRGCLSVFFLLDVT